jgi:carbon dioxide concentrating mechanism protein CcmN
MQGVTALAAFYVTGAVTIAPDAAIAPGVILKAMPGSHLVIGKRACIGAGVVIQAQRGSLTLGEGASLGTGVLVMGCGVIGTHSCVGAESTLINPAIGDAEVLPARSLRGDTSRHPTESSTATVERNGTTAPPFGEQPSSAAQAVTSPPSPNGTAASQTLPSSPGAGTVYGREQITLLIHTLFPHPQPLSTTNSENNSENSGNNS